MVARGVEIGVHSCTGRADRPQRAEPLLTAFRRDYAGGVWIDHQPHSNCEAITNRGWVRSSSWHMLAMLRRFGFRYLWAVRETPLGAGSLNMLAPERPAAQPAVLYTHSEVSGHGAKPLELFSSAWLVSSRRRFVERFSEPRLRQFERERGLLFAHVYLETHRRKQPRHRRLLRRLAASRYQLRPEVDRLFVRLARHQARGDLWVAGLEAIADHLRAALAVKVEHVAAGVVLSSPVAVRGLTVRLPAAVAEVRVDGSAPAGKRWRDGRLEIWFDLRAGQQRKVSFGDRNGRPIQVVESASVRMQGSSATR